jgi:hypothetical protein
VATAQQIAAMLSQGSVPDSGGNAVQMHLGIIQSWDELSGVNTVAVNGVSIPNLDVIDSGLGVLYQPGDVVIIARSASKYFVWGKLGSPGAGAASTVRSASVATTVNQPLQGYGDLTGSFGPELTSVYIGSSRRCLVLVSSHIATNDSAGKMGFQVTGASSIAPTDARTAYVSGPSDTSGSAGTIASATQQVVLTAADGLNQGFNTFTAKYSITNAGGTPAGTGAIFRYRTLTVIPL